MDVASRIYTASGNQITRPANTTAYAANDAVANDATAGNVTPIAFTVTDANGQPVTLERLRIITTDTGVASKSFRAWFFRASPVPGAGDNGAFAYAKANFIGTMSGQFKIAASDGCVGVLVPDDGARIITKPSSGKIVYALLQTLDAFTPSGNSTTFDTLLEGFEGAN